MKTHDQIIIEGTVFNVDRESQQLIQASNPDNRSSFNSLSLQGDVYEGNYLLSEKRLLDRDVNIGTVYFDENITPVSIPSPVITGKEISSELAASFNEQSYKQDLGVLLVDDRIAQRLQGQLPRIDIAGDNYIVDWRLQELRHESECDSLINLKFLPISSDGDKYLAFYHLVSKQVVEINSSITSMPENIVMLEIPNELSLDPVGVARQYGLEDTALLRNFPIRDSLKASVKPLTETAVPDLIKKNQHKKNNGNNHKPFRRGRGHGL